MIGVGDFVVSTPAKFRSVSSSATSATSAASFGDSSDTEVGNEDRLVNGFLSLIQLDGDVRLFYLVHKAVHMFYTCKYERSDIACVFAIASVHYE